MISEVEFTTADLFLLKAQTHGVRIPVSSYDPQLVARTLDFGIILQNLTGKQRKMTANRN